MNCIASTLQKHVVGPGRVAIFATDPEKHTDVNEMVWRGTPPLKQKLHLSTTIPAAPSIASQFQRRFPPQISFQKDVAQLGEVV
jgi:hypothetical protein